MPKVEMFECYEVVAAFEDEPHRIMQPREMWYDEFDATLTSAIKRAVDLGCTVIVNRHRVEHFDNDNDPRWNDWPQAQHVIKQKQTARGWEPMQKEDA